MSAATEDWWRAQLPDEENVLWAGRPDKGYFPLSFEWLYKCILGLFTALWLSSPWLFDNVWDFWKLFLSTIGIGFVLWVDQFVRSQRVYVVTSKNAWELNKNLKAKSLTVDRYLNVRSGRRGVLFAHHPFFSFDHLSDPDAALKALNQAREAQT